jgi:acetyltransferase
MVRFGQLVTEQPWVKEIDINPLLAGSEKIVALDARIIVHDLDVTEAELPKPAIRPYPSQYAGPWTMKDNSDVTIRPIRPEDEPALARFHESLSERTVYLRFVQMLKLSQRVAHDRLVRICFNDYDREMALVGDRTNPETGQPQIMGVVRLKRAISTNEAEFSILIADAFQGKGLGTEMLRRLLDVARKEKLSAVTADILIDNFIMRHICDKLGFRFTREQDDPMVKARIDFQ